MKRKVQNLSKVSHTQNVIHVGDYHPFLSGKKIEIINQPVQLSDVPLVFCSHLLCKRCIAKIDLRKKNEIENKSNTVKKRTYAKQ